MCIYIYMCVFILIYICPSDAGCTSLATLHNEKRQFAVLQPANQTRCSVRLRSLSTNHWLEGLGRSAACRLHTAASIRSARRPAALMPRPAARLLAD